MGRRSRVAGSDVADAVAFSIAAMAPDLDLLFGAHRGPSHSVGAACLAGLVVYAVSRRGRFAAALALAYGTHALLDWLGHDTTPPIGVMALWPFSGAYYEAGLHLFPAISRRYWLPDFWTDNVRAVGRELTVLAPIVVATAWLRWRKRPIGSAHGPAEAE
jgi:hypothetical protein